MENKKNGRQWEKTEMKRRVENIGNKKLLYEGSKYKKNELGHAVYNKKNIERNTFLQINGFTMFWPGRSLKRNLPMKSLPLEIRIWLLITDSNYILDLLYIYHETLI